MTDNRIVLATDGEIARVSIDRPEDGNLMSAAMIAELTRLLNGAGRDPALKAIVLTGAGDDFCLGREPGAGGSGRTALEMREGLTSPILGLYAAVRGAEIPVVASVQGQAAGFGCATAAVCDITVAADDATFNLPEMTHDLPPTLAMCAHIDRTMPKAIAWLVYSTGTVDAETARTLGFVSNVVPADSLRDETESLLAALTSRRRDALITCKQFLANARLMETDKAADYAGNLLSVILSSR
ncbi:MAG: enoyl-CoA hydratase/isomerase family protein [Defluviicoccus sp.]|nr:enoyl-CoA hydratase/isomerase family protein [Defluviicoccus sp.]MDE0277143.1 enoyl-CoA hydratase/isomerase family protein [Defluviicoccus sp.]